MPSNEGRGYVLRRIMRRAMRHTHLLGATDPVIYKLVDYLCKEMGDAFPELNKENTLIKNTIKDEEIKFKDTLDRGLNLLENEIDNKVSNVLAISFLSTTRSTCPLSLKYSLV